METLKDYWNFQVKLHHEKQIPKIDIDKKQTSLLDSGCMSLQENNTNMADTMIEYIVKALHYPNHIICEEMYLESASA